MATTWRACTPGHGEDKGVTAELLRREADSRRQAAESYDAKRAEEKRICASTKQELIEKYQASMAKRQYSDARSLMLKCTFSDGDSDFRKYANAARRAELERTVNSKEAPATRLAAAIALRDDFPEGAAKAEGLVKSLTAQVAAAERDELKRQGVRIGMSQDDVIASSWGRPRKVNRTTTPTHVREQWVYDGGYLYFTDGVLDAIQN